VAHHQHAVARHADVEFERVHADAQRRGEAALRVLGGMPARAAVALQIEGRGALQAQRQRCCQQHAGQRAGGLGRNEHRRHRRFS
jgi:hypothetical protein